MNGERYTGVSAIGEAQIAVGDPDLAPANPLLAPQLITERISRKGRKSTVLTEAGKQLVRNQFQSDFVVKSQADPIGFLNQETFDTRIAEMKSTYEDTKAKDRTADQKFNYLTVKSLEMHRKRLADAELYGSMSASNSPWQNVAETLHQSIRTEDGSKPKYSQRFILNALKPAARTVLAQTESVAPDNPLLQKYLTNRVTESISAEITNLPVTTGGKVRFDNLIYQSLETEQTLTDDLNPADRRQKLAEAVRTEAIKNRALAQVDSLLWETTENPSFTETEIKRILKERQQEDGNFNPDYIIDLFTNRPVDAKAILEDPQDWIDQFPEEARTTIRNWLDSFSHQPNIASFGLSHEQTQKLLLQKAGLLDKKSENLAADKETKLAKARNPQEVMTQLYRLYLDLGFDRDIAMLTLFDEPWITPDLKDSFVREVGYSPEQATVEEAAEKLGWRQRKMARKLTERFSNLFGRPVEDVDEILNVVGVSNRKIAGKLRRVMSPGYLKEWGTKWMKPVNTFRIGVNLLSFGGEAFWLTHQIGEVLHSQRDINNLAVGVDLDGDNLADRQVSVQQAKDFAVRDEKTGQSSVRLDLNGDGLVDALIATPTADIEENLTKTAQSTLAAEVTQQAQSTAQSTPQSESQISEIRDAQWLAKVQTEVNKQEDQPLTIKSLLSPVIDPLTQGRVEACNEDIDQCRLVLGDDGVKFPGIVVWFVGIDDEKIGGRGDAIHGLALNAETGEVTQLSINRDTRVPGMSGMPGAPINTAPFIDQGELQKTGKYVYHPERVQQILQEATGLPADLVIEVSWNGLTELVKFLYGVNDNETIPMIIKEGEEFYTSDPRLLDLAGPDGKLEAGTYALTPTDVVTALRERKGAAGGTFNREARQSDFISQIIVDALSKSKEDPTSIVRLIKDLPSVLEKMEENKDWMRVTGNIPMEFDTDKDGKPELHEFAQAVQSKYADTLLRSISHPVQWIKQIGKLAEGLLHRNQIVPTRDAGNPAQLVSDGSKMIMTDEEGSSEGNTAIVFKPDPTLNERLSYWQRLRDWSRKTVLINK